MYAIVAAGGKQYKVSTGDKVKVERITDEIGESIELEDVLLIADGKNVRVGCPVVENAKVVAQVTGHGRGKKVIAFKYKRRKGYSRKVGHRQGYTELQIGEIKTGGE